MGVHGLLNVDCVMEWFPGMPENWKLMTVPFVALTLGGMNWKIPPWASAVEPTWMVTTVELVEFEFCAKARLKADKEAITVAKRILELGR